MKRLRTGELTAANISNRSVGHSVSITGRGVLAVVMVVARVVVMAGALLVSHIVNRGATDDCGVRGGDEEDGDEKLGDEHGDDLVGSQLGG